MLSASPFWGIVAGHSVVCSRRGCLCNVSQLRRFLLYQVAALLLERANRSNCPSSGCAEQSVQTLVVLRDHGPLHGSVGLLCLHGEVPDSLPEARRYLEQALGILTHEPERSNTEAYALAGFAAVAFKQGNYSEALDSDRRCLQVYQKKLYTEPHLSWVAPLAGMAAVYYARQQWDDFQVVTEKAYQIAASTMTADDPRRLNVELMVARLREHQQSFSDANFLLQDVLAKSPQQRPRTQQVREAAQLDLKSLPVSDLPLTEASPESSTIHPCMIRGHYHARQRGNRTVIGRASVEAETWASASTKKNNRKYLSQGPRLV